MVKGVHLGPWRRKGPPWRRQGCLQTLGDSFFLPEKPEKDVKKSESSTVARANGGVCSMLGSSWTLIDIRKKSLRQHSSEVRLGREL